VLAPSASAHHNRGTYVPAALDTTVEGPRFVVHYDDSVTPAEYAQAGLADFEESYSRLIAGGGGTPNAGLEPPTNDGDGRTDVYLSAPLNRPGFSGGIVYRDSDDPQHTAGAAYVFLTPNSARDTFRFRAAHEFMHVLQRGYYPPGGSLWEEGTANWAADFALPDVDPGDHRFNTPWIPFDCAHADWEGTNCGTGYAQWTFFLMLQEKYGADVIHGLMDEQRSLCPAGCSPELSRQIVNEELADQGGGTLGERYAEYARLLLDPAAWQSNALTAIHNRIGPPKHFLVAQHEASGPQAHTIDHLGTRYVRVLNHNGFEPSGPNDRVTVRVTRPPGLVAPTHVLQRPNGLRGLSSVAQTGAAGDSTFPDLNADPAQVAELWIPLVNDSETSDDLQFGYEVAWARGTPTPPANDERSGARTLKLGKQVTASNAYAGGNGTTEAYGCNLAAGATRGVWYRFTAPAKGRYTFSAGGSDFHAVVSLHRGSSYRGCGAQLDAPAASATLLKGDAINVYVGRLRDAAASGGTTLKLLASDGRSPACVAADARYAKAEKAYSKARTAHKRAKGAAKQRAKKKLAAAKKKLASAKKARATACAKKPAPQGAQRATAAAR
jgi:hypothetical protein